MPLPKHPGRSSPFPLVDAAEAELRLDDLEADRRRRANARHFHGTIVPLIRGLGMNAILTVVFLYYQLAWRAAPTAAVWTFAIAVEVYCLVSWFVLRAWWERVRPLVDLTDVFIVLDILVCAWATYVTGADQSPLYFLLLLRLADQTLTFRTALALAHLIPAVFIGMLAYVSYADGRLVAPGPAAVKVFLLYGSGIYFAVIATMAESLRARLGASIGFGRGLIEELEEKSARLEYSMQKAEDASRMKSQFLSTVSHELRTPLTGVLSQTELLIEDADPARDTALIADLRVVQTSALQLGEIINDILDFAKIESGTMTLARDKFEVGAVVDEAVRTIRPAAERAGIDVVVSCPTAAGSMYGDRSRLRQVLLNLLGNAVKFTERGMIGIRVERAAGEADELIFQVWDTGIGMPPEIPSGVYTAFRQGDPSTTRRYGGTGLGLAISNRFIDMMKGTLSHTTTRGEGSVFTVRIPAGPGDGPGRPAAVAAAAGGDA